MFVTMVRTEPEKRNWDLYNAAVKESNNKWKIVDDAMRRHVSTMSIQEFFSIVLRTILSCMCHYIALQ